MSQPEEATKTLGVYSVRWRGKYTRDVGREFIMAYSSDEAKRIFEYSSDTLREVTEVHKLEEPKAPAPENVYALFHRNAGTAFEWLVGVYATEELALKAHDATVDKKKFEFRVIVTPFVTA